MDADTAPPECDQRDSCTNRGSFGSVSGDPRPRGRTRSHSAEGFRSIIGFWWRMSRGRVVADNRGVPEQGGDQIGGWVAVGGACGRPRTRVTHPPRWARPARVVSRSDLDAPLSQSRALWVAITNGGGRASWPGVRRLSAHRTAGHPHGPAVGALSPIRTRRLVYPAACVDRPATAR
jgi:hypothetical protein